MGLQDQLAALRHTYTTYGIGLLQNRAYRILKERTAHILAPHDISPSDWGLLGLLYETKAPIQFSHIAQSLDVEPPLITRMVQHLEEKGFVERRQDTEDKRVFTVILTHSGGTFVKSTEKIVRSHMRGLIGGVGLRDLLGYIRTIDAIAKAGQDSASKGPLNS